MRCAIEAVAIIGPGLAGWEQARAVLAGAARYEATPTTIPAAAGLPPTERRRVGPPVRLALALGEQLFSATDADPATTVAVFASSGADGDICHQLCETLASVDPMVSPTRFTNSVHNAPSGYWSIAARATPAIASICAHDASFGAGLVEAAAYVAAESRSVALIAYDVPYPFPISQTRAIGAPCGVALLLAPQPRASSLAMMTLHGLQSGTPDRLDDEQLESLRMQTPAGRALPLLAAIARRHEGPLALEMLDGEVLALEVERCG